MRHLAPGWLLLVLAGTAIAQAPTTPAATPALELELDRAPWISEEIGDGVTWRSAWFESLFDAPQSLNVLEVELRPRGARLRFAAPDPFARVPVSRLAGEPRALAAVNGGFFDVANGTPLGLLRSDGITRREQDQGRTVAIGVGRDERVTIEARGPGDWRQAVHARGSWPMLLRDGRAVSVGRPEMRDRRHPRTAAGLRGKDVLVLVTVDGRTERAAGMTLPELGETMRALGCDDAMNLDGGGSTTMWLRGRGVVSFPCDNGRYDHAGERAVSDALLVFAPARVTCDEDRAVLTPADAWTAPQTDERCVGGDFVAAARGGAVARFEVDLPGAGLYRVELRTRPVPSAATALLCRIDEHEPHRVDARRAAHRWVEVATSTLAERVTITLRADGDAIFALDAVRLVEVDDRRR